MLHTLFLSFALASRMALLPQQPDSLRPDTEGLRVNPGLGGMIEVEVTVAPSGRVEGAAVSASALSGIGHQEVETCITTSVRNWRFEKGPFATETIVYPFNLVRNRGVVSNTRA